jgi:ornithine carbamoyltransferase
MLKRTNKLILIAKRNLSVSWDKKNFLSISQLSNNQLEELLAHAISIKSSFKQKAEIARAAKPLEGFSMSMIFQKRSTRTRVSTETGFFLLGGHALMLGPQDVQLGVNETMKDTGTQMYNLI